MQKAKSAFRKIFSQLPAISLMIYPLIVFLLGHLLFDQFGSLFAVHGLRASESLLSGEDHHEAISSGHVWAATAHAFILVQLFTMLVLFMWIRSKTKGFQTTLYFFAVGILITSGLAHLHYVIINSRPLSAIFQITFQSLQLNDHLEARPILPSIFCTLVIINMLSIVVIAALLPFLPLIVREPHGGWREENLLNRVQDLRLWTVLASVFLIAGTLHMYAWMTWATELLNKTALEAVVGSVCFYWGSVFTVTLAAAYLPVLLTLKNRAEIVMEAQHVQLIDRDEWLKRRGLSFRVVDQVPQVIGILAPLAAAPAGQFLTSLSTLVPS